jgi:hypothetical protein
MREVAMSKTPCPSSATLREFLLDHLLESAASQWRAHVESCKGCLKILDQESDNTDCWRTCKVFSVAAGPG